MPLKALFLVLLFQTLRSIFILKCTNLKVVYRITLIVLVIGKAQFRRAMLSCDSSCLKLYSPVCVRPGRKPRRPVFSERGSVKLQNNSIIGT